VTNTEALRELRSIVSTIEERLENARGEIKRVEAEQSKSADLLIEIRIRFALIEENVKELKKSAEEKDRRHWAIILALIGCLLTLAANIGLSYMKFNK
jgi:predicted  nucleic acid-binding Zn-ribbon protein